MNKRKPFASVSTDTFRSEVGVGEVKEVKLTQYQKDFLDDLRRRMSAGSVVIESKSGFGKK